MTTSQLSRTDGLKNTLGLTLRTRNHRHREGAGRYPEPGCSEGEYLEIAKVALVASYLETASASCEDVSVLSRSVDVGFMLGC